MPKVAVNAAPFSSSPCRGEFCFGVTGLAATRHAALILLGFDALVAGNMKLGLSYNATPSRDVVDQGVNARLMMTF
ncbi:hypothetical protein J5277_28780 [Rhizobium sp. 16-449-1b]|uniref:hypothetical protein n=1 Tax=Rhizobium sp. 16-449-1b TaxID=2819989 RepID=UPI001ADB4508|nr:hypothetical protein [Rhizobium sp. 16-449-1b]MBO9198128.1 hypothetical protein [Rhizobium sp. 16-449-1b]